MINWLTSDTHFGHENIIRYCGRPFKSLKEMDETLVKNWNSRVSKGDTVYFLGDFCFKKSTEAPNANAFEYYREQLNGNIVFIGGNHDRQNRNKTILQGCVVCLGGQQIYLVHDPKHMNPAYKLGFCGHVHEKWKIVKYGPTVIVNVGVDQWNFFPIEINQINKALAKWRTTHDIS